MIDYKKHFIEQYLKDKSEEEAKFLRNQLQAIEEKNPMTPDYIQAYFNALYLEYYGFYSPNMINCKTKLFSLFYLMVDVTLERSQADDLKAICLIEENCYKIKHKNHLNQHYWGHLKLFKDLKCDYNSFKINLFRYSRSDLSKYVEYDQLKFKDNKYQDIQKNIRQDLELFFQDITSENNDYYKNTPVHDFLKTQHNMFVDELVSRTIEIAIRFQKFIVKDDTNYSKERPSELLLDELNRANDSDTIQEIQNGTTKINSVTFKTTNNKKLVFDSNQTKLYIKNELFHNIVIKGFNTIVTANAAKAAEAINKFFKQPHTYLLREIAEVCIDCNLLELKNTAQRIEFENNDNKANRLAITSSSLVYNFMYDIATKIVGDLPGLKKNKEKNSKITIDDNDREAKRLYVRSRLDMFIIPLRFNF